MQPISDYNTKDNFLRLLLQGEPGSGKTTVACNFPGAYVIDIDGNLAGPLRYQQNHGKSVPVGYDRLDIDEGGKNVDKLQRYTRFEKLVNEAANNPTIETIIIDSATALADVLWAETEKRQPSVKDGRQMWGFFLQYGKHLMGQLTQIRKHIVMTAHERLEKNELDQTIKVKVVWPGQLGDYISAFFTDNWRCECNPGVGFNAPHVWNIKTLGDYRMSLKNSFELPTTFQFDWKLIESKLKATTPTTQAK